MELKADHERFKAEIERRGILFLVHFTPTINLLSMVTEGKIYSRQRLTELDIEKTDCLDYISFTDSIRYDDKHYINLSIQFPNYFLLSKFRKKTEPMPQIHWCILKIDPKYIYESSTLFAITNAASNCAKNKYGITPDFEKFRQMFSDSLIIQSSTSVRTLHRNGLNDCHPTDVQAEVLVKEEISLDDVTSVCFETNEDLASTKAAIPGPIHDIFKVEPSLFQNVRL